MLLRGFYNCLWLFWLILLNQIKCNIWGRFLRPDLKHFYYPKARFSVERKSGIAIILTWDLREIIHNNGFCINVHFIIFRSSPNSILQTSGLFWKNITALFRWQMATFWFIQLLRLLFSKQVKSAIYDIISTHSEIWCSVDIINVHSLCNVFQRCPAPKICVRHEFPVHWCIQGNPGEWCHNVISVEVETVEQSLRQ